MDPMARIDLAVDELLAVDIEEKQLIERHATLIRERAQMNNNATFHKPAAPIMDRSAGIVSRTAAVLALTSMFGIIGAGTTEKGTAIMHDAVCAAPFMSCDPK